MVLSGNLGQIVQSDDPQVQEVIKGIHALSEVYPVSIGVRLDKENDHNIDLYERSGYSMVVKSELGGLDLWSMFRPSNQGGE